MIVNQGRM